MAVLPLKSSRMKQWAIVHFLWAKEHSAHAIHSEMHPVTIVFLARWRKCWLDRNLPQIWRCNGPFISGFRSSRLRFFASGIHKLVERWDKCLNKLGGYVEKWLHNARKSLHLKFQTGKNLLVGFCRPICLTCSLLLVTPRPNCVAAAGGWIFHRVTAVSYTHLTLPTKRIV